MIMSKKNYKEQIENSPYSKEAKETGSRLYSLRTEKRLSMADVVARVESAQRDEDKQVKLSKSQYARYELGTAFINTEVVYALCEFYQTSPDFLLLGKKSTGKESGDYDISNLISPISGENLQSFCDFLESLANVLRKIAKDK